MTGRIKRVRAIPVVYRMGEAFSDSLYAFSVRSNLVVVAELDDGIVGYGEAAIFGGPPDTTRAVLEQEIVPHYLGQSPFDVERLWDEAYHRTYQHGRHGIVMAALAGVDIAVWDLLAKCVGRPLVDVLGAYRRELPCYASGGFYRAEGTLDRKSVV